MPHAPSEALDADVRVVDTGISAIANAELSLVTKTHHGRPQKY